MENYGPNNTSAVSGAANIHLAAEAHLAAIRGNCFYAFGTFLLTDIQLIRCRNALAAASHDIISLIPASVWLFDNYHLLYHQLKEVRSAVLSRSAARLPAVKKAGTRVRLPRIAALADVIVEACEKQIDVDTLLGLLELYQKQCILDSDEIWLLSPWLRLVMLHKLADKINTIMRWIDIKAQADRLADDLDEIEGVESSELLRIMSSQKIYTDNEDEIVWKAHMIYRLRRRSYLDEGISELINAGSLDTSENSAGTIGDIISREEKAQTELEREVSALIISLKNLSMLDWSSVFDQASCLEDILQADPAGIYDLMDSESRAYYRRRVTRLAKKCGLTECQLAEKLQLFCEHYKKQEAGTGYSEDSHIHNGVALLGYLKQKFHKSLGIKGAGSGKRKLLAVAYFFSVTVVSTTFLILFMLMSMTAFSNVTVFAMTGVASLLPLIGCAAGSVNVIFHRLVRPKPVISMDYSEGLPDEAKTFVVMPVIFSDEKQVKSAVLHLEKHYLANPQTNLYFAILGDLPDSPFQKSPADDMILSRISLEIEQLNHRYPAAAENLFYGFMRERVWNSAEHCWMGWERKRGKLEEFNRLLRSDPQSTWGQRLPSPDFLNNFQYVLTLDADTELVRNSAAHLAGIISHPLNSPVLDKTNRKLKRGYAILQSSMKNRLRSGTDSLFSHLLSNPAGIDPYESVSSDIYQDTFHEGTYAGKGIYSINAMQMLLTGNLPENYVLSHDLLESCYARCAFVSNIQLIDRFPSGFLSFMRREHRWIRGDWQLLPWLFRYDRLSGLSRWKIFDNIRRSMNAPTCLLLILITAVFAPSAVWIALLPALYLPTLRLVQYVGGNLIRKLLHPFTHLAWRFFAIETTKILMQELFSFAVLPYRAWNALDAALRSLYRMIISHRLLLEWQTAAVGDHKNHPRLWHYIAEMWPSLTSGTVLLLLALTPLAGKADKYSVVWTVIIGICWLFSPFFSWKLSLKKTEGLAEKNIDDSDKRILMNIAVDSWHYFAEQSDEKTGWLTPDNWQEDPGPRRSDKTSPTNIGMQLLSVLAARDLGFSGIVSTIENCENIMETVLSLPRFRGHLYNWYKLDTGEILHPDYISTVDSGNLLASLITLQQGLAELRSQEILTTENQMSLKHLCQRCELTEQAALLPVTSADKWSRLLRVLLKMSGAEIEIDDKGLKTESGWLNYHICSWLEDCTAGLISSDIKNKTLAELAKAGNKQAQNLIGRIDRLIIKTDAFCQQMDFSWLYDHKRNLFRIGYRVSAGELDSSCYDLLASEARLASFLAIAMNHVPAIHWKRLGRPLTIVSGSPALVSWSGSLFEYLLPDIFMRTSSGSMLSLSSIAAVRQQIWHGRNQRIPWGISESQYYRFDQEGNYQYRAFGVNRLRLQASRYPARVTAPYATLLALMIMPEQAMINIRHLLRLGARGRYGLYEAVDFTETTPGFEFKAERTDRIGGKDNTRIVRSHMAHHIGMGLLSIDNLLVHDAMRRRFHESPVTAAASSLLEETVSSPLITSGGRHFTLSSLEQETDDEPLALRRESPYEEHRAYHVLAGNSYKVVIDSAGEGFSQFENIRINRWQAVRSNSPQGQFIYLRDMTDGHVWSCTDEPVSDQASECKVLFGIDKAEFMRHERNIMTNLEITVAPQESFELRRLFISNQSKTIKTLEITSFLEPVLTTESADRSHPAFNRLFLEMEYINDRHLLICRRRTAGNEQEHYLAHQLILPDKSAGAEFEIDRLGFIGRDQTLHEPDSLFTGRLHSCRQGFSPEPAMSLRTSLQLMPGASTVLVFLTGYGKSRSDIMRLSYEARQSSFAANIFTRALVHARLKLKYLDVSGKDYLQITGAAASVYDPRQAVSKSHAFLNKLKTGQKGLWRFGISGDLPLILVQVDSSRDLPVIDQYLQLFEVFMLNLIEVDFVIICNEISGYRQELFHQVLAKTDHLKISIQPGRHRNPYVLAGHELTEQEYCLLICSACLLAGNISAVAEADTSVASKVLLNDHNETDTSDKPVLESEQQQRIENSVLAGEQLQQRQGKYGENCFWNGIGYFSADGKSYEIELDNGIHTPAPWSNIIANDNFGFIVTDNGSGYTWSENSQSGKLTPWSNDPVINPPKETVIVRDEETGLITSPCRYHADAKGNYSVSHRFGSSVFAHNDLTLEEKLTVTVDHTEQVRYWHLRLKNLSRHKRSLAVVLYVDLVLGVHEDMTARFINISYDEHNQLLTAVNHYQDESSQRTAFVFSSEHIDSWTSDRHAYLGLSALPAKPNELINSSHLKKLNGSGHAPCAVVMVKFQLHDSESKEIVFGLGSTTTTSAAIELAANCRSNRNFHKNLERVSAYWRQILGSAEISSPDRALDIMFNGWLLYQVISCRLKARTGFYQCGGAYGFRDQLQDSLALLKTDSEFIRKHLLRCAGRQFCEGDVQHWWHEDSSIGVRTTISDDLLWFPYVLCKYVNWTGDLTILDEQSAWLEGDVLAPGEHDRAFLADKTDYTSSIFEHALAAIKHASTHGPHNLPLIRGGDWNDGINLAGIENRGESVWLSWFIVSVIDMFSDLCDRLGKKDLAESLSRSAEEYIQATESAAWDGKWYLRGWFDNGQPMGSRKNLECRIDSISQSWAVLSGRARSERLRLALESADHYLVKDQDGTVMLLAPPFDGLGPEPGYIRRYYPGIRENGGQYTHAAVWLALSYLRSGRSTQGAHLLSLINPINHSLQPADVSRFTTEPYVLPADIYDGEPYCGHGGWSWYTGSAAWYYQTVFHELLGLIESDGKLSIKPRLSDSLLPLTVKYQYHGSIYTINMKRSSGQHPKAHGIWLDQIQIDGTILRLEPGGGRHNIIAYIDKVQDGE